VLSLSTWSISESKFFNDFEVVNERKVAEILRSLLEKFQKLLELLQKLLKLPQKLLKFALLGF
jgi:hypothetical protein